SGAGLLLTMGGSDWICATVTECASRNEDCMSTTTCSASEPYCMTTVASAGIGKELSFGTSLGSGSVSCCSTSLCNVSGASGIKYSYSALVLSLGVLASRNCEI
uniref:Uncharacterized protein n=1 Tax=Xenopus tropicalis TaxID=8364 RepID=A0A6I8Q673_XENTR